MGGASASAVTAKHKLARHAKTARRSNPHRAAAMSAISDSSIQMFGETEPNVTYPLQRDVRGLRSNHDQFCIGAE
jgi:hypothetical protein